MECLVTAITLLALGRTYQASWEGRGSVSSTTIKSPRKDAWRWAEQKRLRQITSYSQCADLCKYYCHKLGQYDGHSGS